MSDARVMFDKDTGKSRGYGFVSFRVKEDAEQAIREMNGVWLGQKAIRCNWANAKPAAATGAPPKRVEFDDAVKASSSYNTTVYVGNLPPEITQDVLRNEFAPHGPIAEVRTTDKGYGFVVYSTHESAARAISSMHGAMLLGRQIRCSWGKDPGQGGAKSAAAVPMPAAPPVAPYPGYPPAYPTYAAPSPYGAYPYPAAQYPGYAAPGYGAGYPGAPAYGAYPGRQ